MVEYLNSIDEKNVKGNIIIGISNLNTDFFNNEISNIINKDKNTISFKTISSTILSEDYNANKLITVGLGNEEKTSINVLQELFSQIAKNIEGETYIYVDSFKSLTNEFNKFIELLVETIGLVKYKFNGYKTENDNKDYSITLVSKEDIINSIEVGKINYESTNSARNLVNEPRNKLTPEILANYAANLATNFNLDYKIYNKSEIEELKMGAFLAVNQGSTNEPKLIHIKYRNSDSDEIVALVGKGLTYDAGGYSIKQSMVGMKGDMGGAATVLGALESIVRKKLKVNVDLIIAATENLINGSAMVPDDVITAMNGKTIEVLNTDAEGRLTLVDAVTFAKQNGATKIIDVATLTGGIVVALGHNYTGGFTNNQEFYEQFRLASVETNEGLWQMPIDEEFKKRVRKSPVADFNNSPGRDGHPSFAATIIGEFAEETPWIHLDIAGSSEKKGDHTLGGKGPTGAMVRTISKFFE